MIRPLFGWLRGRAAVDPIEQSGIERAGVAQNTSDRDTAGRLASEDDAGRSGRAAGRREVAAIEALRNTTFVDREQAALHTQLARAPRDVGALFGLLAWHARRGESTEMASFAHALWDETDAEGELWRRAAALGRSIDPHNPLYDENPFAALAAHAALQPVTATLALDAFDLSLPHGDSSNAGGVLGNSSVDSSADSLADTSCAPSGMPGGRRDVSLDPPFFNIFNQPKGQLPASVLSLDMDLDTPSTAASTWLAGFPSSTAPNTATNAETRPAKNTAASALPPLSKAETTPAWVLARPRRVRGRTRGRVNPPSKK